MNQSIYQSNFQQYTIEVYVSRGFTEVTIKYSVKGCTRSTEIDIQFRCRYKSLKI